MFDTTKAPRLNEYLQVVIQRTGNPTAPLLLQQVGSGVDRLGAMLAPSCDPTRVTELTELLLQAFPDPENLEEVTRTTEFVVTLCALLHTSLISWVNTGVEISRALPWKE